MRNPFKRLPSGPGWARAIANHIKLVLRLLRDRRVHPLLKLVPFTGLLYLVFPFDIPLPIDDIGVLWLTSSLFIEMAPASVVEEHRRALEPPLPAATSAVPSLPSGSPDS